MTEWQDKVTRMLSAMQELLEHHCEKLEHLSNLSDIYKVECHNLEKRIQELEDNT